MPLLDRTCGLHELLFVVIATCAQDALMGSQDGDPAAESPALIHESFRPLVTQVMHVVNPLVFTGQTASVVETVDLLLGKGGAVAATELADLLKPFMLTPIGRELVAAAQMDVAELQQREERLRQLRELHGPLLQLLDAVPHGASQADKERRHLQGTTLQSGLELIAQHSDLINACPLTLDKCIRYRAKAAGWVQSMEALAASTWEKAVANVLDHEGRIVPDQAHAFRELRDHWHELAAARALVTLDTGLLAEEEEGGAELHELPSWQQDELWREQWANLLDSLYELHELHGQAGAPAEGETLPLLTRAAEALQAAAATLQSQASLAEAPQQQQIRAITATVVHMVSLHAMTAFDQFMECLVGKDTTFKGDDNLLHFLPIDTPLGISLPCLAATGRRLGAMASIASHQPEPAEHPAIIVLSELLSYAPLAKQLEALHAMSLLQRACARCLGEAARVQETLAEDSLPDMFIDLLIAADQLLQGAVAAAGQAAKDRCQLAAHRLL